MMKFTWPEEMIAMAPSTDVRQRVYDQIKQAILASELKPRERLTETGLAAQLAVSRTPIREAIQKLEREGLVERSSQTGTVVADIRPEDVADIYEMRAYLEALAVRSALPHYRAADYAGMKAILAQIEDAETATDWRLLLGLTAAFHDAMCIPCGRPRLLQTLTHLKEQSLRFRSIVLVYRINDAANSFREHTDLYATIRRGDPDEVERTVRNHLMLGPDRVKQALRPARV
jgi:DNA-binding GntR family transcriptional regulator